MGRLTNAYRRAQEFRRPGQAEVQERDILLGRDDMDAAEESENWRGRSHSHDRDARDFTVRFHLSLHLALNGFCRRFD